MILKETNDNPVIMNPAKGVKKENVRKYVIGKVVEIDIANLTYRYMSLSYRKCRA